VNTPPDGIAIRFPENGAPSRGEFLYGCDWNSGTLKLLVDTLSQDMPQGVVSITGYRNGSRIRQSSLKQFQTEWTDQERVDESGGDPTVTIEAAGSDLHAAFRLAPDASHFFVEGPTPIAKARVEGLLELALKIGRKARGRREKPLRVNQWLTAGLGLAGGLATVGVVAGLLPGGAVGWLLAAAGAVVGGMVGLWIGLRCIERARTRIRLSESVELGGGKSWTRADKIALGALFVAFLTLIATASSIMVSHHDAQQVKPPGISSTPSLAPVSPTTSRR